MTKVLEATCVAGVVTADGVAVPEADILSQGVGESEGVLILDESDAKYIADTSDDLKSTLDNLIDVLGDIASALTSIDSAGYVIAVVGSASGVPSPPVATSSIAQINAVKAELQALKEELK